MSFAAETCYTPDIAVHEKKGEKACCVLCGGEGRKAGRWGTIPVAFHTAAYPGHGYAGKSPTLSASGAGTAASPLDDAGYGPAVTLIRRAIAEKQPMVIYGDYDVDGVCATSILLETLREEGALVDTYIPSRHGEGYGLNCDAVAGNCPGAPSADYRGLRDYQPSGGAPGPDAGHDGDRQRPPSAGGYAFPRGCSAQSPAGGLSLPGGCVAPGWR